MYIETNPNPDGKVVSDCTIRAISLATDKTWYEVAAHTFSQAYQMCDMPSSNQVWGSYLAELGYQRHTLPDTCPFCYTVEDFAAEHPTGTYIVGADGHVVCVKDGDILDTWYSGGLTALYFWEKEQDNG